MPKHILTLIVDSASEAKGWLNTLEDAGSRNVTSSLAKNYADWLIIVSTKIDTWSSLWKKVVKSRDAKSHAFEKKGFVVVHTLVFAPSHGVFDGSSLQWLPAVRSMPRLKPRTSLHEWLIARVHGTELPVNMAMEMALQHSYAAVHFHCCNVGMHLGTLLVTPRNRVVKNVTPLRVTAFKQVSWVSYNANSADRWIVSGFQQRAEFIPIGDGWLFRVVKDGDRFALTETQTAWENPETRAQCCSRRRAGDGRRGRGGRGTGLIRSMEQLAKHTYTWIKY